MLEGFGVSASYGRLREACQTDVDGTSIDALEDVASKLGLKAEQVMLPVDHLLLDEARALPALVVVRLPNGFTHFVVVWRKHGPLLQVMDPASGRRWMSHAQLLRDLFVHELSVAAADFAEWAESADFRAPLDRRMHRLRLGARARARAQEVATAGGWRAIAALDAAVRSVASLVEGGALRAGNEAERGLAAFMEDEGAIPPAYFTARPDPDAPADEPRVKLRGAVLIRVSAARRPATRDGELAPELARALEEKPIRPAQQLLRMTRDGGWHAAATLLLAFVSTAAGAIVEPMLLRASLDVPRLLGTVQQRLVAMTMLVTLVAALRAADGPVAMGALRIGRQLELRFRSSFLEKLPRIDPRYFQSRPVSDMAERAHATHEIRRFPELGTRLVGAVTGLVMTGAAIAWLDHGSRILALAIGLLAVSLPFAWLPALLERDMRVRTHRGALTRMTLDVLLGLMPVRTHGADLAVRREHEGLVVEWGRASRALVRASGWAEAVPSLAVTIAVAWMIVSYVRRASDPAGVLLLAFWALTLPLYADEIANQLRQYPGVRNVILRVLEPLGAVEEEREPLDAGPNHGVERGAAIAISGVGAVAAGHTILKEIDLRIDPGEHVAVVGASGAGKSSLAGLLLGWHRPAIGSIFVDGAPLDARRLDEVRRFTAWVDPEVRIWNRSLIDNLRYGCDGEPRAGDRLAGVLDAAEIVPMLDRFAEGMQTALGEGGSLVSGGEGQRVRLGRAMMRPSARLVILDEAFRGLQRDRRRELLTAARAWWKGATLLCITHDLAETLAFDRVLVLEGGRLVEDGVPRELAVDAKSLYASMLAAERALFEELWGGPQWRRVRLEGGRLANAWPDTPSRVRAVSQQRSS
jgi:ATP-binding cassette subfamily B protein